MNVLRLILNFFGFNLLLIFYWNIEWTEKRCYFRRKKQLYYPLSRIATSAQADFLLRLARMLGGTHKVWSEKKNRELFSVRLSIHTRRKHTGTHKWKVHSRQMMMRVRGPETQAIRIRTHRWMVWRCGGKIRPVCDELPQVCTIHESRESFALRKIQPSHGWDTTAIEHLTTSTWTRECLCVSEWHQHTRTHGSHSTSTSTIDTDNQQCTAWKRRAEKKRKKR